MAKKKHPVLRYIFLTPVLGAFGLLILWSLGLASFILTISALSPDHASKIKTDGIVVLTGGAERVQTGLVLLKNEQARELLISGVHKAADLKDLLLLAHMPTDDFPCCITLGFEALDTIGNAQETAHWAKTRNIKTLRLVTANYHMPRAYVEMRRAMPEVKITTHAVKPEGFSVTKPKGLFLAIKEYHKTILATARWIKDLAT